MILEEPRSLHSFFYLLNQVQQDVFTFYGSLSDSLLQTLSALFAEKVKFLLSLGEDYLLLALIPFIHEG